MKLLSEQVDQWGMPLFEGLSAILYHKTNHVAKILASDEFQLSFAQSADEIGKKDTSKWFYLSTARSPVGAYEGGLETLVLDGAKLGQRYAGGPIDYWGPTFRKASQGRSHELEDRVWSRDRVIPNAKSYIKEVHIKQPHPGRYEHDDYKRDLRFIYTECKRAGIPVFFYDDYDAYKVLNKAKAVQPDLEIKKPSPEDEPYEVVPGVLRKLGARPKRTDGHYVDGLIHLYWMNPEQLDWNSSDPAIKKAWNAYRNISGMDRGSGVEADIHNLKRESEMDSLAEVMRDGGFKNLKELFAFIEKKFEPVIRKRYEGSGS